MQRSKVERRLEYERPDMEDKIFKFHPMGNPQGIWLAGIDCTIAMFGIGNLERDVSYIDRENRRMALEIVFTTDQSPRQYEAVFALRVRPSGEMVISYSNVKYQLEGYGMVPAFRDSDAEPYTANRAQKLNDCIAKNLA